MENDLTLVFDVETPESSDARRLIARLDEELYSRYPPDLVHGLNAAEVADWRGVFVIARLDGRAVGCGAIRPLTSGVGEVKRMFVEPDLRGRRIGRMILEKLEAFAREKGMTTLRLETGTRQPEAMSLYESMGYRRIPLFGDYVGDPFSVCYEKRLEGQGGNAPL